MIVTNVEIVALVLTVIVPVKVFCPVFTVTGEDVAYPGPALPVSIQLAGATSGVLTGRMLTPARFIVKSPAVAG